MAESKMTKYAANLILDFIDLKTTKYEAGNLYLGLSTSQPNTDGGGYAEPTDNNYARVQVGSPTIGELRYFGYASADDGSYTNTKQIAFKKVKSTTGWGTCTYACLFDGAGSGAHLLWYGELTNPITPVAGDVAIVEKGQITIKIA